MMSAKNGGIHKTRIIEKNGYQQEKFKFKDYAEMDKFDYIFIRIEEMFLTMTSILSFK